ncbi:unnamed protein product [Penicillium camemberti]|uniref:Str. FM013 n=1 Tax=Penicillium camemberti (strain FM 013) TaxID=1429867 RepID=A0A0G4P5Q5_PENC3|nr:unnamed protein product [Penicillium camemberti]
MTADIEVVPALTRTCPNNDGLATRHMTVCSLFPLIPFLLPCLPSYVGRSPRTP